jgi:hypothetical protein
VKEGGLKLLQITDNGHGINVGLPLKLNVAIAYCSSRRKIFPSYASALLPQNLKPSRISLPSEPTDFEAKLWLASVILPI